LALNENKIKLNVTIIIIIIIIIQIPTTINDIKKRQTVYEYRNIEELS
jgi:hypothetical protein